MTAEERVVGPYLKLGRAETHIESVSAAIEAFRDTKPFEIATKRDPQTRRLIYYVVAVKPIPASLEVIIGDALFNLRSALDHLAQQFYLLGTGSAQTSARTAFPICDDFRAYQTESPRRLTGMRQDAIDFINGRKPYKGGDDALWQLNSLNNIDKHRLLITVGGSFRSFNVGAALPKSFEKMFTDRGASVPKFELFLRPEDPMCPLKIGDELLIDLPDAEPHMGLEFRFDVSLHEPPIVAAQPLLETLGSLRDAVKRIVGDAAPFLA